MTNTEKKIVLLFLMDQFADWEAAYLAPALAGENPEASRYEARTVTVQGTPVRSCGNLLVQPDYSLETVPNDYAALILVGGMQWQSETAKKILPLVEKTVQENKILGAICNASLFLGAHGYLNSVQHTGNTKDEIKRWAGTTYTNEEAYLEKQAVRDRNIITANGTASLEFTREILLALQADSQEQIQRFYNFHKKGFYPA